MVCATVQRIKTFNQNRLVQPSPLLNFLKRINTLLAACDIVQKEEKFSLLITFSYLILKYSVPYNFQIPLRVVPTATPTPYHCP